MGMATTNLQGVIGISTAGGSQESLDKLAAGLQAVGQGLDNVSKKSEQVKPPAWDRFAESVKNGIQNPLQAAGNAAESLLKGLGPVGGIIAATAATLATAGKVGMDAARSLGEYGDRIEDIGIRTGLTNKEVYQFSFAMKRAGGDISSIESTIRKLSQGLADTGEEGKKVREGLHDLGISSRDVYGNIRPTSQILVQIAEGLKDMPDMWKRNAIGAKIMGRSFLELLPDLLELSEGLKRAGEVVIAPTDAQFGRWKAYHQQIVEFDETWARLKRNMKDPLAGTVLLTLQLVGGAWETMSRLVGLGALGRAYGSKPKEDILPGGYMPGDSESISAHRRMQAGMEMADRNWESATSRFYGTKEGVQYRMQEAKSKATEARGAYFALSDQEVSLSEERRLYDAWQTAEKHLEKLKAQEEALNEAEKKRKDTLTAIDALQARADETGLVGMEKISAEWNNWLTKFPVIGHELENVNALFGELWSEERRKEADKLIEEFDKLAEKAGELPNWLKVLAGQGEGLGLWAQSLQRLRLTPTNQAEIDAFHAASAQWPGGFLRNVGAMQDVAYQSRRGGVEMLGERALRISELSYGPNQEVAAINASYSLRSSLADRIYEIEKTRAAEVASREKTDAERRWKLAEELAKAKDGWDKALLAAEIEHELKIAELQRRRLDELRNRAGEFFDAMLQGGKGLEQFFSNMVKDWGRTIFQNAAVELLKGQSGHFSIGGQGTVDNPTTLGRVLAGTPFGLDPLKGAGMRLDTAGMRLQLAAGELIGAAHALAMSPTGGGGGLVNAIRMAGFGGGEEGGFIGGYDPGEGVADYPGLSPAERASVGGWLNPQSGGGAGMSGLMRGAGIAGAGLAGAYGMYSGIRSGGARGGLAAAGSGIAAASSILALAGVAASTLGPIGMLAGMGIGPLISLFGDPKADRRAELERSEQARAFSDPTGRDYVTDLYGRSLDYDYRGGMRTFVYNDQRSYNAIDAPSFVEWGKRNSAAVAEVTTAAISSGNAEDMVGTLRQVL